jgi:site-specific recombinase XerD
MKQRGIFEKVPGSGVWWIHWYDAQGRRHREKAGMKSAAILLYRKRKQEALEGRKLPEKLRRRPVLFCEIAQDALGYSSHHKRSASDDRCRMSKFLEWFSDRVAEAITAAKIEECFHSEKWTAATWNRYRSLLSLTYRLAIRAGKVRDNPARLVRHKTESNGRVRFLSREEEDQLRTAILQRFPEHLSEFELAISTGLRRSEQYRAQWQNVDFERRVLTVPLDKTGRTSHVPLNASASHALVALHARTADSGLVCGGLQSPRSWFERALAAAGVSDFHWHDLRHTFASRLVMSGADLRTVAELLRDSSLAMVMRYAHLAPDYRLAAVERMDIAFVTESTATRTATNARNASTSRAGVLQ